MKDASTSSLLYVTALSIALLMLAACQPMAPAAATEAPTATEAPAAAAPILVEHEIPTKGARAGGLVTGPDGAIWFVETGKNQIGRITMDGTVTEFPLPTANSIDFEKGFIGVGPDGALWFNKDRTHKLGRVTTDGEFSEFALPEGYGIVRSLVAGPDGNLWITGPFNNSILKLDTQGNVLADYTVPPADSMPFGMVAGPDGALWFSDIGADEIGRITTDGEIEKFPLPKGSDARRLTLGPDGALWIAMYGRDKVARLSTDGQLTEFDAPDMSPVGITPGPDGAVWFTGFGSNEIGRLTTDGTLTRLPVPTGAWGPYHIISGPDGNLWFTEQRGNNIGQIILPQSGEAPAAATESAPAALQPAAPRPAEVLAEWDISVPQGFAFGFDAVWVPSARPNVVTRLDPASNQVAAVIEHTGIYAHEANVFGDSVWVPGMYDTTVRIDPTTNEVAARFKGSYLYLAEGFGSLWAPSQDTLNRIDPATGDVIASIQFSDDGFVDCVNPVYTSGAAVWVDHCDAGEWIKVDPADNSVAARTPYSDLVSQAEAQQALPSGKGTDFMWMLLGDGLLRLDPVTGEGLSFLPLTPEQNSMPGFPPAVTDDSVWVPGDGQLLQVDVPTNEIVAIYTLNYGGETGVAAGFGSLWTLNVWRSKIQRLDITP
jgi:virginiamycin B lyase